MAVLPAAIKRDVNLWTFHVYMTDAIQAISENTAIPASYYAKGEFGKSMTRRWADKDKPAPPEDTRTAQEIIDHIKTVLGEVT